MIETEMAAFMLNSGMGGVFAYLMYKMTNTTIKDNTTAIRELKTVVYELHMEKK